MNKPSIIGLCLAVVSLAVATVVVSTGASAQPQGAPNVQQMGHQLVESLRAAPGCLGVEVAQTMSGKNVIFAWFQDKESVLAWHNSPTHQRIMDRFFPDRPQNRIPMQHIPDDAGPILTIASLKPATEPLPGTRMPVSELSIEMYAPLPGGIRLNGGFTPAAVPVPGRAEIAPPAAPADAGKPHEGP
jgi:quinol monooxygenase YgiN